MEQEVIDFVQLTQQSFIDCIINEDTGMWKVTQTVTQRRKAKNEDEWDTREVTMSAYAKNIDIALADVFLSMEGYLVTRNHDLFTEPTLVESDELAN